MFEYFTTIRLPNGKQSGIGRLGLCVIIADEPLCFEFSHEELLDALALIKANVQSFKDYEDGYDLKLFFDDGEETEWISRNQLGIAETFVFNDLLKLAGLE